LVPGPPESRTMIDRTPAFVIAVADDDSRILKSLRDLFESAEYAVLSFDSPTALLKSGCLERIDCLISDISMPETDGFELARLAHAARPGLPIILITGRADMLNRMSPAGVGCYRFFRKPFDGDELLATVGEALRSSYRA
jgi:FixJ family two-component response regulator